MGSDRISGLLVTHCPQKQRFYCDENCNHFANNGPILMIFFCFLCENHGNQVLTRNHISDGYKLSHWTPY